MGFIESAYNYGAGKVITAAARAEARHFAKKVKLGRTYYTITQVNQPWGSTPVLEEHVFTRTGLVSALPEGAAELWLQCGPVYDDRNAGACRDVMTLREHNAWVNSADGPGIRGNLNDYSAQPKRGRRAA